MNCEYTFVKISVQKNFTENASNFSLLVPLLGFGVQQYNT